MISKELLSEVFTDGQQDFEVIGIYPEDERLLEYVWIQELPDYSGDGFKRVPMKINIHELAHKCKEWARTKAKENLYTEHLVGVNYPSSSGEKPKVKHFDMWICFTSVLYQHRIGTADTEPEAIFKATSYILENMIKDNK